MKDNPMSKWALPFWMGGAVLFGLAVLYSLLGGGFKLFQLAAFVFFAVMALDTWQKRRKDKQSDQGR